MKYKIITPSEIQESLIHPSPIYQLGETDIEEINRIITTAFKKAWIIQPDQKSVCLIKTICDEIDRDIIFNPSFVHCLPWSPEKKVALRAQVDNLIQEAGYQVIYREKKGLYLKIK